MKHGMSRVEIETFAKPIIMRRSIAVETVTKTALLEVAGSFSLWILQTVVCPISFLACHGAM